MKSRKDIVLGVEGYWLLWEVPEQMEQTTMTGLHVSYIRDATKKRRKWSKKKRLQPYMLLYARKLHSARDGVS